MLLNFLKGTRLEIIMFQRLYPFLLNNRLREFFFSLLFNHEFYHCKILLLDEILFYSWQIIHLEIKLIVATLKMHHCIDVRYFVHCQCQSVNAPTDLFAIHSLFGSYNSYENKDQTRPNTQRDSCGRFGRGSQTISARISKM